MRAVTITEFLLDRIAEDEKVARAAAEDGGGERWQISVVHSAMVQLDDGTEWGGETVIYDEGRPGEEQAAHIARHDPARVLAECKAKREIVRLHATDADCREARNRHGCETLITLVAVFSDHPDFRSEWVA